MGKVQRITDFGAFVEIMPGTDGLLHVSEIANHRVKDVRDELKEGQQILVKVINIDPTGKIRLSRKALLQERDAQSRRKPRPRRRNEAHFADNRLVDGGSSGTRRVPHEPETLRRHVPTVMKITRRLLRTHAYRRRRRAARRSDGRTPARAGPGAQSARVLPSW
mgnify:CR=1 FL=1